MPSWAGRTDRPPRAAVDPTDLRGLDQRFDSRETQKRRDGQAEPRGSIQPALRLVRVACKEVLVRGAVSRNHLFENAYLRLLSRPASESPEAGADVWPLRAACETLSAAASSA